jgi:UDP-glucose 4-epimerase
VNRVLVTGGVGFIGSSLVDALLQSGNEVVVFDHFSKDSQGNLSKWSANQKFKLVLGDMLDRSSLMNVVDSCNTVFHLAANSDVRIGASDTKLDYEQNILATYNLLEAMKNSNNTQCKKIIFTSTSAVYGETLIVPTSETNSVLMPISLYGASKLACEAMISAYCHMFGMSGVVFRLANVIGARSTHGVVYDFVMKLFTNPKYLEILGDGQQNKSYLYIDDCINALMYAGKIQKTFEVFNAGSNDRIKVLDIANIIINELSLDNVSLKFTTGIEGRGWKGDIKEMLLDSSKLCAFGWKAKYNSREAVTLTTRKMINKLRMIGKSDQ